MSLLCKVIGHKFKTKDLKEWGIPYNIFTVTTYYYCLRCNAPNLNNKQSNKRDK